MTRMTDALDIERGVQAIAMIDAMDDPLDYLPADAFDNLMVISAQRHPSEVERKVEESGGDPSKVLVVPVSGSVLRYDGALRVSERVGPNDLTGVGVRFSNGLNEIDPEEGWVVFDNINVFLMYADERRFYQFMQTAVGKAKDRGVRAVYCTVRDAVKDETYARFRQIYDEEIDLR